METAVTRRHSGHDLGEPNLDVLGTLYMGFCIVWTFLLLVGLTFFLLHRHVDFVRMRNACMVTAAILTIHVYLVIVLLQYPINGAFPCDLEFWIMSIQFPLGIALFQAQNVQLLSLSYQQSRMLFGAVGKPRKSPAWKRDLRGLWKRWMILTVLHKTFVVIAILAVLQTIMTTVIFFVSRKFHGSFGITGAYEGPGMCRRGWEWFPSILWQLTWTYLFGPFILVKIQDIRDTHRWRLQTSLAILASFPGPIMWLASVYNDAFAEINLWWPPAMWFAPGLMMMEFILIFFPLLEVYQSSKSHQTALTAISEWEKYQHGSDSASSTSARNISVAPSDSTPRSDRSDRYNMQALERALQTSPGELLEYAATREFTGENIIFLTRVRQWKDSWVQATSNGFVGLEAQYQLLDEAREIFTTVVSMQTAPFPINIESRIYTDLEIVLGTSRSTSPALSNVVAPFDDVTPWEPRQLCNPTPEPIMGHGIELTSSFSSIGVFPPGFNATLFDRAERSVKYMVLTNTWARFIDMQSTTGRSSLGSRHY
ncbi:MAG: hypothetical protein M1838_002198 [Thelocarpon superellum]|nr:MAG: hypothetical protein M1838_002198 [Thelocarpon superellum]